MAKHSETPHKTPWIVGSVVAGTLAAASLIGIGPGQPESVARAAGDMPGAGSEAGDVQLPGAPPFAADLEQRLVDAYEAKGPGYEPRTHHFNEDGSPKYVNRLILEKSPYLLQHAHNPVNWYPWGDEAFERARKENKPVLLSVGYSTCHWCHVMERESFEDEEIARFLNEHYVSVKVDRERRPDVDAIYMEAVRAFSGSGGWPMTAWLTPERKPFFGGTYFPPRDGDRGTRFGFLTLLERLHELYRKNPEQAVAQAEKATAHIRKALASGSSSLSAEVSRKDLVSAVDRTFSSLSARFDRKHGGFGNAPKFPRSVNVEFLLRYHQRTGNEKALTMSVKTLEAMAAGGIYDHVGGGFHRYSTDERWLVPHFEKMLYDNALLTIAYLEAHQATGREDFARVARDVLRYVSREMTSPSGAFYSATDADSEGEEGKFFVWKPDEIADVLGEKRAKGFNAYYGVTEEGNFEHGTTILHVTEPLATVAKRFEMDPATFRTELGKARDALYEVRQKRVPPIKDEKILVSWNGLMISAFARAAHVFGDEDYAERAKKAADFVLGNMKEDGRLHRNWFDGHAEGTGYLDDHAFLIQGLLDLYEATFEPRWIREAIALQNVLEDHFRDDNGGYFATPDDGEDLLAREKPTYDGAEPSGNSVAILNLLRLEEFTVDDRYRVLAEQAFGAFKPVLARGPSTVPKMLTAVEFRLDTPKEIMIVKPDAASSAEPMLAKLRETYLPNRVLAIASEGDGLEEQQKLIPLLQDRIAIKGELTAYVCENRVCDLPTRDPEVFAKQIREKPS